MFRVGVVKGWGDSVLPFYDGLMATDIQVQSLCLFPRCDTYPEEDVKCQQ